MINFTERDVADAGLDMRQAGLADVGLVLAPTNDWLAIENDHTHCDVFAWLSITALVGLVALAIVRQPKVVSAPGSAPVEAPLPAA